MCRYASVGVEHNNGINEKAENNKKENSPAHLVRDLTVRIDYCVERTL